MVCSQTTEPIEPKKEKRPQTAGVRSQGQGQQASYGKVTALPQQAILPRKTSGKELGVVPSRQTRK